MAAPINKDGELIVSVTPDFHSAFITINPHVGHGKPVTYDQIMKTLAENGVRYNINTDMIKEALAEGKFDNQILVSKWKAPVNGQDGSVKYLFDKEIKLVPREDENGIVDYKNLGFVRNIYKETVIAEITYPTEGEPGMDVRGVVVAQKPGKPPAYKLGANTRLSEDKSQILAAEDGHLSYDQKSGFAVSTKLTINSNIDSSIGNIDFIGDVVVNGEVCEGFKVTSSRSIMVVGNANGAVLEAKQNIVVKKGVINSKLNAGNDINAQFCEYSELNCEGDLNAQSFVVCQVHCGGSFHASRSVCGGKYTCLKNSGSMSLGAKTYVPTEILLGDNSILGAEKSALEKEMLELDVQIERNIQVLEFLTAKKKELYKLPEDKEELLGQAAKNKITLGMEKKKKQKRVEEIIALLKQHQDITFECKGIIYPGVKIVIGSESLSITNEMRRIKFGLNEIGEIGTYSI